MCAVDVQVHATKRGKSSVDRGANIDFVAVSECLG